MALPVGVETRTVQIHVPMDMLGTSATAYSGTVKTDRALIWSATGEPIWPVPVRLPAPVDGVIEVEVPIVDQPGMVNGSGADVTGWVYQVTLTGTWSNDMRTVSKRFQVTEASPDPTILDVLLADSLDPGITAPGILEQVQAIRDEVSEISGLTGEDEAVAALVGNPASETGTALDGRISAVLDGEIGLNLGDYPTLKAAIAALPSDGGVIYIPDGRHAAGTWNSTTDYMDKPNVRLIGQRTPRLSSNADRLEAGSVIAGRFNVHAHGFEAENIGFDFGKYEVDTNHGGIDPGGNAFGFGQPNTVTPVAARNQVRLRSIIGLLRDSATNGHAVLIENINGGFVDGVVGIGGQHGVVIKAENMSIGALAGYAATQNCVTIKADTYAACGSLTIDTIAASKSIPGVTPHFTPATPTRGVFFDAATASHSGPMQIGKIRCVDTTTGVRFAGGAGNLTADVQIGEIYAGEAGASMTTGLDFTTSRALRIGVGSLIVVGANQGIGWNAATSGDATEQQLHVESARFNSLSRALNVDGYGRVTIDQLTVKSASNAYYIGDNARVMIGNANLMSVSQLFERAAPARDAGWSNVGSGAQNFAVILDGYGVAAKGWLVAGGSPSANVASLPAYLRPVAVARQTAYRETSGGVGSTGLVTIDSSTAGVTIPAAPSTGDKISLDGIAWLLT